MDLVDSVVGTVTGQIDLDKENVLGIFSNLTLLSMILASLTKDRPFPKTKLTFKNSYDYIIVGGGTAGSVMANRLSQKPCVSVLLLEAGGVAPFLTDIPSLARLFYGSSIDWLYKTEPQQYGGFSQKENRVNWNSGKAIGGSSVLNAMLYVRGNKRNYDQWAAEGATGWSYEDVFPYFLKLEDNKNIQELDPGGPMTVEKPNYSPEIKNPVLEATADLGYEELDINGRRQTGIYDLEATIRNQQRCSTAKAYLVPAEDRPNLDIIKGAFVRKIVIRNRRAVGVEVDYLLGKHFVRAKKEVIVSNGAIRTPQLLMLSGIGPREELEKFNIKVVADLPVGKNLQDHAASALVYQVSDTIMPVVLKNLNPVNILNYITQRKGPLTAPNQCTVLAFLDGLNTTSNSRDFPRQELYFSEYATIDAKMNSNLKDEVYQKVYGPYVLKLLYICLVSLLQPKSRGKITLRSLDPHDYPVIQPNYYENEEDLRDVVEGMKICEAVASHPAMRKVNARPLDTVFPGCEQYVGDVDKYFTCVARQVIYTFWHQVGTARMGSRDDPRSVVDPQLRVIGVRGLRVINAAVMPIVPSANTNVPTMMVAEKAYDMMKDDIKCVRNRRVFPRRRRNRRKHTYSNWY